MTVPIGDALETAKNRIAQLEVKVRGWRATAKTRLSMIEVLEAYTTTEREKREQAEQQVAVSHDLMARMDSVLDPELENYAALHDLVTAELNRCPKTCDPYQKALDAAKQADERIAALTAALEQASRLVHAARHLRHEWPICNEGRCAQDRALVKGTELEDETFDESLADA